LVILAIIVILAIVIFNAISNFFKGTLVAVGIIFVIFAIATGFMTKSALDFKSGFESGSGLLLVASNDFSSLKAGTSLRLPSGDNSTAEPPRILSKAELDNMGLRFASKDYAALVNGSWLIAVKESAVSNASALTNTLPNEDALAAQLAYDLSHEPLFILSQYKKGNAVIYPERLALKAIKVIPESLFEALARRLS